MYSSIHGPLLSDLTLPRAPGLRMGEKRRASKTIPQGELAVVTGLQLYPLLRKRPFQRESDQLGKDV